MNIVHVSTFERSGGAGIAASRLHGGLLELGCRSTLLVRDRTSSDPAPDTHAIDARAPRLTDPALEMVLYSVYQTCREPGVDPLFSTDFPSYRFTDVDAIRTADVVNVHWAAGLLSVPAIRAIQDLGKPVLWTLHDQFPFTGGCHYSGSCRAYEVDCADCRYLITGARSVPQLILKHKTRWLDPGRLTVVSPSEWLAACARRSALLRRANVEVIPNGVPVTRFQRLTRREARSEMGFPQDAVIVLAGSQRLDEQRKGYAHLRTALSKLLDDSSVRQRFERRQLIVTAFGDGKDDAGSPIRHLGTLVGDEQLAMAYRAADLFLLPTLEDNLPNTLLEAVAAGTPVVAYDTGGVPDILNPGQCGVLVPKGDIDAFAHAVRTLIDDEDARTRLGRAGETFARESLDVSVQAAAYQRLYERAIAQSAAQKTITCLPDSVRALQNDERALFKDLLSSPALAEQIVRHSLDERDANQQLIAARGGEICALRQELDRTREEWRISRETLHDAQQRLAAVAKTHEQAGRARTSLEARLGAERAALLKRLRHRMTKVAIYGSHDTARRLWEALSLGGADVVAFIDLNSRRHGRPFLSSIVQPVSWLARGRFDVVAISESDLADPSIASSLAIVNRSQLIPFPAGASDQALTTLVAAHLPDVLSPAHLTGIHDNALRIGIFGTGSAAMKVWEACTEIDTAEVVWFSDNNRQQQGRTLLWLDVIAPDDIPQRSFDFVVVGSMSRDPICAQLRDLGVPAERILTPNVAEDVAALQDELSSAMRERALMEVRQ